MNEQEILLSHPHDFFNLRHITVIPNTCFVLMPFDEKFTIVYETIVKALEGLMVCSRADDLPLGKPILERILRGINSAELIIADLTGRNPNVFYEIGLAHCKTKNVLLLTQDINEVPFDLRGLYCHTYSPHSRDGLQHLTEIVQKAAAEVRAKSLPSMLQGALSRTKQIVEYMERQLASPAGVQNLIIRIQAGFSSLSNVGYWDSKNQGDREYGQWLEKERDLLIKMIEKGATLQAIIYPPRGPWTMQIGARCRKRFDKLLEFLNERNVCLDRCEFVTSTEEGPNLFFFGEDILFEGHKTGIEGGYGWTMIYTDKIYLLTRLTIFDMLFQSAKKHTLATYGTAISLNSEDRKLLLEAVRRAVVMSRDGASPDRWQPKNNN